MMRADVHSPVQQTNATGHGKIDQPQSILLIDTKSDNPNYYIVMAIFQALRSDSRVSRVDKAGYSNALRLARAHRYDILLAVDGEAINIGIFTRLAGLVGTSVLWAWEDPYERSQTLRVAPLFDLIFTNDLGSVAYYPAGARHLPLAASTFLPVRETVSEYDYDLSFVGSAWPNRVVFLRRLLRELPDLRLRIALSYNSFLPRSYLDLPESSYAGAISHCDFLDVANRSRICLTLDRSFSGDGLQTRAANPGPRIFEIALAGGFQIVDDGCGTTDRFYAPNQEMATFTDVADCLDKVRDALRHPERCIAAARAAQIRTQLEHTYAARLSIILDAVNTRKKAADKVQPDLLGGVRKAPARLLFVTHNTVAAGNFGGVEVYQETIADVLRSGHDIFYYRPAHPPVENGWREYVLTDSRHNILNTYRVPDFDVVTTLTSSAAEIAFTKVLNDYAIELVHFHHLINHVPSLPMMSRLLGVPSVFNLQDFWTICTRFNLLDGHGSYCKIAERPKVTCDICLKACSGVSAGAQNNRRSFMGQVLQAFDKLIGSSDSVIKMTRAIYPDLGAEKFILNGLPVPRVAPSAEVPRLQTQVEREAPLRVVFLGNFTHAKGAGTFLAAADILRDDNIGFSICGRIDPPYEDKLRQAALLNVTIAGGFQPGGVDLSLFDVSLHLSIWPETYCITLSEAWRAGVIPIVTDCGALGERVTDGVDGYHVPIEGAGELVSLLRRLQAGRDELARLRDGISARLWLTGEQHCDRLARLYAELIAAHPQCSVRHRVPGAQGDAPTHFPLTGQRLLSPDWTRPDDVVLPSPSASCGPPLSPLRRQLPLVRDALANGRFKPFAPLRWHLDALGSLADPYSDRQSAGPGLTKTTILSQLPLQLIGWLYFSDAVPKTLMLAARSLTGDIILRAAYLHDRPDLDASSHACPQGIGFVTDPFPPQMLEEGVYALELMNLTGDVLEVEPLMAVMSSPNRILSLVAPSQTVVRVPFPDRPSRDAMASPAIAIMGVADTIEVLQPIGGKNCSPSILVVNGWSYSHADSIRHTPVALKLLGEENFHVTMNAVPRLDVLENLDIKSAGPLGYEAAVSLSGIPAGSYTLEIVKYLPEGLAMQRVARLDIEPRSKRICIERVPDMSEARQ